MITREQIEDSQDQPDYVQNTHLRGLLFELLKERDAAVAELSRAREYIYTAKGHFVVDQLKVAEARAEAYREVAVNWSGIEYSPRAYDRADQEAQRILEAKAVGPKDPPKKEDK